MSASRRLFDRVTKGAPQTYRLSGQPYAIGDYDKRIDHDGRELFSGICAGCARPVYEDDPSVIRYHPTERGGIFHMLHAPNDPTWYAIDGEAPYV
jgi:hypothetical protein